MHYYTNKITITTQNPLWSKNQKQKILAQTFKEPYLKICFN